MCLLLNVPFSPGKPKENHFVGGGGRPILTQKQFLSVHLVDDPPLQPHVSLTSVSCRSFCVSLPFGSLCLRRGRLKTKEPQENRRWKPDQNQLSSEWGAFPFTAYKNQGVQIQSKRQGEPKLQTESTPNRQNSGDTHGADLPRVPTHSRPSVSPQEGRGRRPASGSLTRVPEFPSRSHFLC